MGARHYDPELRSFLQPDVHILENPEKGVQDPTNFIWTITPATTLLNIQIQTENLFPY